MCFSIGPQCRRPDSHSADQESSSPDPSIISKLKILEITPFFEKFLLAEQHIFF